MLRDESRKRKRSFSLFQPNKKPKLDKEALQEVIIEVEPTPVIFQPEMNYSQRPLLQKINTYLRQYDRTLFSEEEYCHGLAIVWLQKMSEGNTDWFYYTRDAIIAYPWSRIEEIETDIEKFIALIEAGQNVDQYLKDIEVQDIVSMIEAQQKVETQSKPQPESYSFCTLL